MTDAAYFLGGSLPLEDRRLHEQTLVREYWEALHAHGVRGFDWEHCWEGYRRQVFLGIVMTVAPAMIVQRTERGDEMFLASLARYAQQALDLDSLRAAARGRIGQAAGASPRARGRGTTYAGERGALERELVLRSRIRRWQPRPLHPAGPLSEPGRLLGDRLRLRPGAPDGRGHGLRRADAGRRRAERSRRGADGRAPLRVAAGALPGAAGGHRGGPRGRRGPAARRARRARSRSPSTWSGRRSASPTPTASPRAMRSPAGSAARSPSAASSWSRGRRPARPLLGPAGLVVGRVDVVGRPARGRDPPARRRVPHPRRAAARGRLPAAARGRLLELDAVSASEQVGATG